MRDKIEKLKKYSILFVEDEKDILEIIADTLAKIGVAYHVAANGKEALELYKNNPAIDLIVTDINMPIMTGLEMISKIREDNDDVLCIIMSAHTENPYKDEANRLKVEHYIEKPFDFIKFINLVNDL